MESTPVPTPSTRGGGLKVAWLITEGSFVKEGDVIARFEQRRCAAQPRDAGEHAADTPGEDESHFRQADHGREGARLRSEGCGRRIRVRHDGPAQDATIFSKWATRIEAKINAGFAKDRIEF